MQFKITYTRRGEPQIPAYSHGTNEMIVEADSPEAARRIVATSVEDIMEINTIAAYDKAQSG